MAKLWEVGQPGVFGVADAAFHAAAAAVERVQVGRVRFGQVGDEDLIAVPVDVGEAQLCTRVGLFAAQAARVPGPLVTRVRRRTVAKVGPDGWWCAGECHAGP